MRITPTLTRAGEITVLADNPQNPASPSPGALLRSRREAAGLSIEHVASQLHLMKSIVSSLEADCYDRIRGETYVRGYLRNYARLVGLDSEELLAHYPARRPGSSARR